MCLACIPHLQLRGSKYLPADAAPAGYFSLVHGVHCRSNTETRENWRLRPLPHQPGLAASSPGALEPWSPGLLMLVPEGELCV